MYFYYEFTVENLKARILLNYSQTRYANTTQTLNFVMKGSDSPLEYSQHVQTYTQIETSILVMTVVSMLGLLIGLFVPKFIGLEAIITMQLLYYSQLLIKDISVWPLGFMYFKFLGIAGGYKDLIRVS